ncbi:Gfo/Idh/MocA family protein [Leucobacter soli]|uniref:Gfo/Idh/MocA family protein n=1 Tax=Leucobacter soli TaxID=2812850 RepID=UPI00361A8378
MEAMWQAFLPRTEAIRRLVADGVLGELRFVEAAFGERFDRQAVPRLWDPAAGGGALLDIGVYPIAFALAWLGPATSTTARGSITADGIDERVQLLLEHGGRAISSLATSIDTALQNRAAISGEHAFIVLDDEFYAPGGFELRTRDEAARWEDPTPCGAATGSPTRPEPSPWRSRRGAPRRRSTRRARRSRRSRSSTRPGHS